MDLTTPHELEPYERLVEAVAEARGLDVRRISFPIPDMSVVDDDRYDEAA